MTKRTHFILTIIFNWQTAPLELRDDEILSLKDVDIRVADELTNEAVKEVVVTKVVTTKTIVKRVRR